MKMFYPIKNPPKWLLDGLYNEERSQAGKCPDCQADIGAPHEDGCDVARCLNTKIQKLQCDCGKCGKDMWTGLWPGTQVAYDLHLVCFDTATNSIMFDLNSVTIIEQDNAKSEEKCLN